MEERVAIKPSLRLLKMLGEDLIKDEKTAIIELIKNAYDADASYVNVYFNNFGENFNPTYNSKIIIEDDGHGMTEKIIKEEWLNPGTAYKKRIKNEHVKTKKSRILQGEKGIGRFSMFKLGRTIELQSLHEKEKTLNRVYIDLADFNEDFITENNKTPLLQDMKVSFSLLDISHNRLLEKEGHGTSLTLSNLKGTWTSKKVKEIYFEIAGLQTLSPLIEKWDGDEKVEDLRKGNEKFEVTFYKDKTETPFKDEYRKNLTKLLTLIKEKTFLEIKSGYFDDKKKNFDYFLNGEKKSVNLLDNKMKNLLVYKRYFENERENFEQEVIECGPFSFEFYVFDFSNTALDGYKLSLEERNFLKQYRTYLYRDDIRVYPYGELKDDWLQTDTLRGLYSAGKFFSNDQIVGIVNINYLSNSKLQDKTNREGLIDIGEATNEFKALLQTFLSYLKLNDFNECKNLLLKAAQQKQEMEEAKRKAEEEAKRKSEEEAKRKSEEEAKRKSEEEAKRKAEEEAKRKAEEEAKRKSEEEAKRKAEEEAKRKAEEEAKRKAEEEAKRKAEEEAKQKEGQKDFTEAEIAMKNKERNLFFKRSDVLKSSIESAPFVMEYNQLIDQLTKLNYEKSNLLFVLSFRVLIEDTCKRYLIYRGKKLTRGLGENIALMIEDILSIKDLEKDELELVHQMIGVESSFKSQLRTIKDDFYYKGQQGTLANQLNSLTHTPRKIPTEEALEIANNKILPLIVISEKIIELLKVNTESQTATQNSH